MEIIKKRVRARSRKRSWKSLEADGWAKIEIKRVAHQGKAFVAAEGKRITLEGQAPVHNLRDGKRYWEAQQLHQTTRWRLEERIQEEPNLNSWYWRHQKRTEFWARTPEIIVVSN